MIQSDKPNGYFVTRNQWGHVVEGETRQCSHCQYSWIYKPGSGHRRGFCWKCNGLLCGRSYCMKFDCLTEGAPFSEGAAEQDFSYVPGGLMVQTKLVVKQPNRFRFNADDLPVGFEADKEVG